MGSISVCMIPDVAAWHLRPIMFTSGWIISTYVLWRIVSTVPECVMNVPWRSASFWAEGDLFAESVRGVLLMLQCGFFCLRCLHRREWSGLPDEIKELRSVAAVLAATTLLLSLHSVFLLAHWQLLMISGAAVSVHRAIRMNVSETDRMI